ncbi:hypothetical protein FRC01_004109 [Tulasnella sp. 417]|nr:hypothetical protein FRC01_004109 [Tulasnella sp. 417]
MPDHLFSPIWRNWFVTAIGVLSIVIPFVSAAGLTYATCQVCDPSESGQCNGFLASVPLRTGPQIVTTALITGILSAWQSAGSGQGGLGRGLIRTLVQAFVPEIALFRLHHIGYAMYPKFEEWILPTRAETRCHEFRPTKAQIIAVYLGLLAVRDETPELEKDGPAILWEPAWKDIAHVNINLGPPLDDYPWSRTNTARLYFGAVVSLVVPIGPITTLVAFGLEVHRRPKGASPALAVTGIIWAIGFIFITFLLVKGHYKPFGHRKSIAAPPRAESGTGYYYSLLLVIARAATFGVAIYELSDLPAAAYSQMSWSQYVPHL